MKKKSTSRVDLDWYLIPISNIKKIALIVLSVIIGIGIIYLVFLHFQSPKTKAQGILKEADKKVEEIAQLQNFNLYKGVYVDLKDKLQNAQKLFLEKKYLEVIQISSEVLEEALRTIGTAKERTVRGIEEILDLEGKVQVQRKDQGTWQDAKPRMSLYPGDFVKTYSNGSVRITTRNNCIIVLPPNSLHEVAEPIVTKAGETIEKITMKVGSADIATQNQKAQVVTLQANTELDKFTSAYVVTGEEKGEIQVARGVARATVGDEIIELGSLQKLELDKEKGAQKYNILPSPKHIEPVLNKAFLYNPHLKIRIAWENLEGAVSYVIQISPTSFFLEPNEDKRTKNFVFIQGAEPGDYYWRVRAIDELGNSSPWSLATKFRILTGSEMEKLDKIPPFLEVKADVPLGNQCIVKGKTEPGAIIIIEGETITPNVDGTFTTTVSLKFVGENIINVQAVDPAGNEANKRLRVVVRE